LRLSSAYFQHTFSNGLTLLVEKMAGVRSASMNLLVPCGAASDPEGLIGLATVLSEMTLRGAGPRDSRTLTDHLDRLGLQRSMNTGLYHTRYTAAAVAQAIVESLEVYADIVQRPVLSDDGFEPARDLSLQSLEGLADDPRTLALIELRKCHWPAPLNRNAMGEPADLQNLTAEDCRVAFKSRYAPAGSILAIAGDVDAQKILPLVDKLFGSWTKPAPGEWKLIESKEPFKYVEQASEQTHIGIACPTLDETHPQYYVARVMAEILSGGMSGRLFTEIREKRGLCYSVGVSYGAIRGRASLLGYAGTSNERAQETLDALIAEMQRLSQGVTQGEVDRARIGLKASTIMSGESSPARAGAIASDFFSRGRIRSLEEIDREISAVTLERVNEFVAAHPLKDFTVVVIGPKNLTVAPDVLAKGQRSTVGGRRHDQT
jgi:predicted Zn-dependent peptidase